MKALTHREKLDAKIAEDSAIEEINEQPEIIKTPGQRNRERVEGLPSTTRIERLLAMTLLELCGLQRRMEVKEQVSLLGRAGFTITEAAEIIGTSRSTIYVATQRGRKAAAPPGEPGEASEG
jgi:DNA-directed RNA polymerase specialized sigma24 family protein